MGMFAILLAIVAIVALWTSVRAMQLRILPENRMLRGLRFLGTGLSIGLLIEVGFSVLRIFTLPATGWVPILLITSAAGFAFGYFLTGSGTDEVEYDDLAAAEAIVDAFAE